MGTNLQAMNLTAEHYGGEKTNGCNDYLVISYPIAVETIHRAFLEVGVDVIVTDTFRSNRLTLAEYGLGERVAEINLAAARLARKVADEFSTAEHPRFVAGSIGPSGKLPSLDDPQMAISFTELVELFREQATALIQGGVDLLLVETSQDILEVKAVIHGIQRAFQETGISFANPGAGQPGYQRAHAARHGYQRRVGHPGGTADRCDRDELLDRSGTHARVAALPGRTIQPAGIMHPQCRSATER